MLYQVYINKAVWILVARGWAVMKWYLGKSSDIKENKTLKTLTKAATNEQTDQWLTDIWTDQTTQRRVYETVNN